LYHHKKGNRFQYTDDTTLHIEDDCLLCDDT
jgi:hypothetical protein